MEEARKVNGGGAAHGMESTEMMGNKEGYGHAEEMNGKSNEMEQTKLTLMRAFVEKEDPSSKFPVVRENYSWLWDFDLLPFTDPTLGYILEAGEIDDLTIRRFLRARDLDVVKASAMFLKYLKWRREFVPNGSVSPSEVPNEIGQNKMFLQGSDRKGRPIAVVLGARHVQDKKGVDEFKRFLVYGLDKVCARMPPGQEKFVAIGDLEGWGYANSDIRGYLAALCVVQDYYPERLGKMFIVNVPYVFMAVWKIAYPFIDSKTRTKIVFVENKKLKSTLLEDIDESQIPEKYGGQLALVPIHELS